MGAVYQAEHTHMHKRLAVKVLHPEMSRLPEVVARFEREAMAAAHIEHPNVASATDFGKLDDGSFFLVLEYVEGQSLRDAIAAGRFELSRALHVALQMASALARAHDMGIVHRDLKPDNVMLVTRDGRPDFVKVLDFGIAKVPVGELGGDSKVPGNALTQLGMVYGTPEYMAPEQALGQPVDARADLYALGIILFEMLTGTRPYQHESKVTLLGMHVTAPIPAMKERAPEADIPNELDAIVTRLLAKEASARFANARELIVALETCTANLMAQGRIAELPATSTPASSQSRRASGSRFTGPEAPTASGPLALGPTRLALPRVGAAVGSAGVRLGASLRRLATSIGGLVAPPLRRAMESRKGLGAWVTRRRVAVAGTAAGVLTVLSIVVVSGSRGRSAAPVPTQDAIGMGSESMVPPRAGDPRLDRAVASAQTSLDKGDYPTAIEELEEAEKISSDRADIHLLLERAYRGIRDTRDAMREAGMLLVLDANAGADPKLQEDIRNAALFRDSQDEAFALLESKMGARGVDLLYDIAYGPSARLYTQAAARAKRSLSLDEVRGRATSATSILLDYREAKNCEAKHALLSRVRDEADSRMLPLLQTAQQTRGCGFLGVADCYFCMRKDDLLSDATTSVEERSNKEP
jgi:serine/threonine-protein kinase